MSVQLEPPLIVFEKHRRESTSVAMVASRLLETTLGAGSYADHRQGLSSGRRISSTCLLGITIIGAVLLRAALT
jgi:hypothetical protein